MTDLHPLTELLLARLAAHPDEFLKNPSRWNDAVSALEQSGFDADRRAWNNAKKKVLLDLAHEKALDELMNGPERRAKAAEEQKRMQSAKVEHARKTLAAIQQMKLEQQLEQDKTYQQPLSVQSNTNSLGSFLNQALGKIL